MEAASLRAAGLSIDWIAPLLVILGLLLVTFMIFKLKILTWLLLGLLNIALFAYLIHIWEKTSNNDEDQPRSEEFAQEKHAKIPTTRVSSKRIFV